MSAPAAELAVGELAAAEPAAAEPVEAAPQEIYLNIPTAWLCSCGHYHGPMTNGKEYKPKCVTDSSDTFHFMLGGEEIDPETAKSAIQFATANLSVPGKVGPTFAAIFPGVATVAIGKTEAKLGPLDPRHWAQMIAAVPKIVEGVPPHKTDLKGNEFMDYHMARFDMQNRALVRECRERGMRPAKYEAALISHSASGSSWCDITLSSSNQLRVLVGYTWHTLTGEGQESVLKQLPVTVEGVTISLVSWGDVPKEF